MRRCWRREKEDDIIDTNIWIYLQKNDFANLKQHCVIFFYCWLYISVFYEQNHRERNHIFISARSKPSPIFWALRTQCTSPYGIWYVWRLAVRVYGMVPRKKKSQPGLLSLVLDALNPHNTNSLVLWWWWARANRRGQSLKNKTFKNGGIRSRLPRHQQARRWKK